MVALLLDNLSRLLLLRVFEKFELHVFDWVHDHLSLRLDRSDRTSVLALNRRDLGNGSLSGALDTKLGGLRGTAPLALCHNGLIFLGLQLHALVVAILLGVNTEVDAAGGRHTLSLLLALEDHHGLEADSILGGV